MSALATSHRAITTAEIVMRAAQLDATQLDALVAASRVLPHEATDLALARARRAMRRRAAWLRHVEAVSVAVSRSVKSAGWAGPEPVVLGAVLDAVLAEMTGVPELRQAWDTAMPRT